MQVSSRHAEYLHDAIVGRKSNVANALRAIKNSKADITHIAVQGVSGLLFGSVLAYRLDLPIIVVRKNTIATQQTHSRFLVEGLPEYHTEPVRYLFVDDFVHSGSTFERVANAINMKHARATCIGGYMYHRGVVHPHLKINDAWADYVGNRSRLGKAKIRELMSYQKPDETDNIEF